MFLVANLNLLVFFFFLSGFSFGIATFLFQQGRNEFLPVAHGRGLGVIGERENLQSH